MTANARFVRDHVHELRSISPDDGAGDDLEAFSRIAEGEGVRVVAIGEGAHFMKEYWSIRRRLFRHLHERFGFDVFAMEFGFAEGFVLDRWVRGEGGDDGLEEYGRAAARWGAGETMRWLRRYNRLQAARGAAVRFAGIDLPEAAGAPSTALLPFCEYAVRVEPRLEGSLREAVAICEKIDGPSSLAAAVRWRELPVEEQDRLFAILHNARLRFHALEPHYAEAGGPGAHAVALRELDAAVCTLYLLRSIGEGGVAGGLPLDVSVREHFMAQSVLWLLRAHPQSRVFLLAHNNHVQKTPVAYGAYVAAIPMGRYLQQSLGGGYRAVAVTSTARHTAEMRLDDASPTGFRVEDVPLRDARPGSVNAFLEENGLAGRPVLIDLSTDAAVDFDSIRSQSAFVDTSVKAAFDAVVSLPQVTLDDAVRF
ncbi:MAG: erythromycin esterase family protein [Acidobacteriota bacterium]|jgi:erythromycin esterase|nr:erythromycin esterase family protein [Acidobacteriota bacterium]